MWWRLLEYGATEARQTFAHLAPAPSAETETCVLLDVDGTQLRLTSEYRHLGCMQTSARTLSREVANRTASGNAVAAQLYRPVFRKLWIPAQVRLNTAKACIHSRILHNAGTWDSLGNPQLERIDAAYMRPLRYMVGALRPPADGGDWITNDSARRQLHMPPIRAVLDCAVLRYAPRATGRAPSYLAALIQGPGGREWRQTLIDKLL